jgi:hypothetical protein
MQDGTTRVGTEKARVEVRSRNSEVCCRLVNRLGGPEVRTRTCGSGLEVRFRGPVVDPLWSGKGVRVKRESGYFQGVRVLCGGIGPSEGSEKSTRGRGPNSRSDCGCFKETFVDCGLAGQVLG